VLKATAENNGPYANCLSYAMFPGPVAAADDGVVTAEGVQVVLTGEAEQVDVATQVSIPVLGSLKYCVIVCRALQE
jgi:hypothetical protein